jgi:hypothetical protein
VLLQLVMAQVQQQVSAPQCRQQKRQLLGRLALVPLLLRHLLRRLLLLWTMQEAAVQQHQPQEL